MAKPIMKLRIRVINTLLLTAFILPALLLGNLAVMPAPSSQAQLYPVSALFFNPWSSGLPLLPALLPPPPLPVLTAPPVTFPLPLPAVPSPFSLSRAAAVVTAASSVVVTTVAPSATVIPPATTPAGLTLTSLIPATAPAPVLPLTTTTVYGSLTSLVLAGTSPYTLLSFLLL